jgi:3'(2'), 5'-bisphosphate nucleotidase
MSLSDVELAARLAEAAGRVALAVRDSGIWSGAALGDAGDRMTNALIMGGLAAARPEDAVLCEECADVGVRAEAKRVWIVDPLDGTREYREGLEDWAVHVALTQGGRPVAAALAVPARGWLLRSDSVSRPFDGAQDRLRSKRAEDELRMVVSRTRAPAEAARVAAAIGAELVPMGSAGAKAAAVIRGEADIYFHAGGQNEWDNCAPVGVALAAGLYAGRLDGSAIVYNQGNPIVPDLLICRPELAARVRDVLGR